jgi:hypothetical protein
LLYQVRGGVSLKSLWRLHQVIESQEFAAGNRMHLAVEVLQHLSPVLIALILPVLQEWI